MKRISFRTARRGVTTPALSRKAGVGVLMMGLALMASAADSIPPGTPKVTSIETKAGMKTGSKTKSWFQTGMASWYGLKFQGRKTSTGEAFDMNSMTCAHPTLPMGTWVRVTNMKNKKTAFVRVNDRGPAFEGRIVDLSMAAAHAVGLAGIGKVKLERVREGDPELAQAMMAQVQLPLLFASTGR